MKSFRKKLPSTQKYLNIAQVKEDTVILKDGSLRMVMLASSINFALKGDDEQRAIISAYMGFLNSLDFPLQIVIQSRRLNIDQYLDELRKRAEKQTNELLQIQTQEYHAFVKDLVSLGEIMSKKFYVVVSYSEREDHKRGFFRRFKSVLSPSSVIEMREKKFREMKASLMKRVDQIASSLVSFGVTTALLDTQSLIELFYTTYNPDIAQIEKIEDVGEIRMEQ